MREIIKVEYVCEKKDYKYVVNQLKKNGYKIQDVCKQLGISRSWFYDMLVGNRNLSKGILLKLVTDYGVIFPYRAYRY